MTYGVMAIIKHLQEDSYLLIKSRQDFGHYRDYYYPPGGHVEEGESVEDALKRELSEELNLNIDLVRKIAVTPGDNKDQTLYWWECRIIGGVLSMNPQEIADVGYFSKQQRETMPLWPATRAFFRDYIDGPKAKVEREK